MTFAAAKGRARGAVEDDQEEKSETAEVAETGESDRGERTQPGVIETGGVTASVIKAGFIEPMLLLPVEKLSEGPASFVELKLDGYRAIAIKTGGKVQLGLGMTMTSARGIPES